MRYRFFALFALVIVIASSITNTVHAVTYDENFFRLDNITYYDPRCATDNTTATRVQLAGKDNTQKILNFFMSSPQNLSLAQASGIVGNMMQESGLNPAIIQGGKIADGDYTPVGGVGFGLVQWTSSGRQVNLVKYMKGLGVPITDLSGQLGFTWKEINDSYKDTLRKLKATNDPVQAAIVVHDGYESSADSDETVRTVRGGNAKKVYDTFKDAPALAGTTASPDQQTDASTTTTSASSDGSSSASCNSDSAGEFTGGDLPKTVKAYAWSQYISGSSTSLPEAKGKTVAATDQRPDYSNAIKRAQRENRYIGGAAGNDCGGFVTTLVHDSGFDTKYNSGSLKGNTIGQEKWLQQNWQKVGANDPRKPGDVAINEDHTYIYVGSVDGFGSKIASASYSDRAPMAGKESPTDSSFRWYRKK